MTTWILVNNVTLNGFKFLPGHVIDDAVNSVASVTAVGGELWPMGDASVVAMATAVTAAHATRGLNEAEMESRMRAATEASLYAQGGTILGAAAGLTASPTRTQAGALVLTKKVNRIDTSTAPAVGTTLGDGVMLPPSAAGATAMVINNTANLIQVYGTGADTINGAAVLVRQAL